MEFLGKLNTAVQLRVTESDRCLNSAARLDALSRTGLMDSPAEEPFDRLARLAAKILKAPLTIISLVSDHKQFFKAGYGLPAPFDQQREVPIDSSICRYTLHGEPIVVDDASTDEFLRYHPTTQPWGIGSFLALPMKTSEGHVLGSFCAVHATKHQWTDEEVMVMAELTNSVMTEIELRMQVKDLELERTVRERFVAALSHDLRTPLTAAKMSAQLLGRKANDPDAVRRIAVRIAGSMDRADQMIQDLLDMARIRSGGGVPLMCQSFCLATLVRTTLEELATVHGDRFVLRGPETLVGFWDESLFRRVLENLVGNALKYGNSDTAITVSLETDQATVQMSVQNEGNPIPEENLAELFRAFHRTDEAARGAERGWGLGLMLVHGFCDAMGGSVAVESSETAGTTFTVKIPHTLRES